MVGEMLSATFDVICEVALSGREHFDAEAYGHAILRYFETAGKASVLDFLRVPDWVPRPGALLSLGAVRTMHRMVAQAIEARRKETTGKADDLLDYMLKSEDPVTGRRMSPTDLLHNMQFFIVAGHETTALALSWSLLLLALDPQRRRARADEARSVLGDRAAGAADLAAMPYVKQVLDEAMRLYPPVGMLARNVRAEDTLAGGRSCPATSSSCRSTRSIATACGGSGRTHSIRSGSRPRRCAPATAISTCRSAPARASASARTSP